jgi:hypothetical protein
MEPNPVQIWGSRKFGGEFVIFWREYSSEDGVSSFCRTLGAVLPLTRHAQGLQNKSRSDVFTDSIF